MSWNVERERLTRAIRKQDITDFRTKEYHQLLQEKGSDKGEINENPGNSEARGVIAVNADIMTCFHKPQ